MNILNKITKGHFVSSGVIITYDFTDNKISAKELEEYTKTINGGIPTLTTTIKDSNTGILYSLPNTTLYHDGNADSAAVVFNSAFENLQISKKVSTSIERILIVEIGNKFGVALNKII